MLSGLYEFGESLKALSLSCSRELLFSPARGDDDFTNGGSSDEGEKEKNRRGEDEKPRDSSDAEYEEDHATRSLNEDDAETHFETAFHHLSIEELRAITTKTTSIATTSRDSEGKKVNQYVLVKTIGKGSYSKVKLCVNTDDNELYAMKICSKKLLLRKRRGKASALDDVLKEVELLSRLRHPNLVLLHEVINDPQQDYIYMVSEYLEGGPVMEGKLENEPLEMKTARSYFRDVIRGVRYLHENQIIHGDLKPENMLCTLDWRVKLIDLGNAVSFGVTEAYVGTPAFMPPELCYGSHNGSKGLMENRGAMPSRDIWALGVCLYCFVFGRVPFLDHTLIAVCNKIKNDPVLFPSEIDPECTELISRMLTKDPTERISLDDIEKHPWVIKDDSTEPP